MQMTTNAGSDHDHKITLGSIDDSLTVRMRELAVGQVLIENIYGNEVLRIPLAELSAGKRLTYVAHERQEWTLGGPYAMKETNTVPLTIKSEASATADLGWRSGGKQSADYLGDDTIAGTNAVITRTIDELVTIDKDCKHHAFVIEGNGKLILTISADGKVELHPDADLTGVKSLPIAYLRMVQEIVNTAIYDKEHEHGSR